MDEQVKAPDGGTGDGKQGWTSPDDERQARWIGQLQTMIDDLATTARPHVREIAAKAAELAAKAGEAAGPLAERAAVVTSDVGHRVAVRGREVAADLRRSGQEAPAEEAAGDTSGGAGASAPTAGEPTGPEEP